MRVVHIMADGSTRESIDGMVIKSKDFYEVLNGIQRKGTA